MAEAEDSVPGGVHVVTTVVPIEGEDRRKHLDFIQATITRMSSASTTTKSWMLPVVTATYGYALTKNADSVAALGIGAVVLFAYLDANYLRAERRFRCLYEAVIAGADGIALFSLNPFDATQDGAGRFSDDWPARMPKWINAAIPGPKIWKSWAVGPFYGVLVAVGVGIGIRAALLGPAGCL